jgi:hypothetical protein
MEDLCCRLWLWGGIRRVNRMGQKVLVVGGAEKVNLVEGNFLDRSKFYVLNSSKKFHSLLATFPSFLVNIIQSTTQGRMQRPRGVQNKQQILLALKVIKLKT